MQNDPQDFRLHYAGLSDEALLALNRTDLIDIAQTCYDEELARRELTHGTLTNSAEQLDPSLTPGQNAPNIATTEYIKAAARIFRSLDMDKRILFTLGMLAIYWLGACIPAPAIDYRKLAAVLSRGGIFPVISILSLGVQPYVIAWVVLQVLAIVVPTVGKLKKENEFGQSVITKWTRYFTLVLALLQSFGIGLALQASSLDFVSKPGIVFLLMTMFTLTTGALLAMWLSEQITESGIGNGMVLLFTTQTGVRRWSLIQHSIILAITIAAVISIDLVIGHRTRNRASDTLLSNTATGSS